MRYTYQKISKCNKLCCFDKEPIGYLASIFDIKYVYSTLNLAYWSLDLWNNSEKTFVCDCQWKVIEI